MLTNRTVELHFPIGVYVIDNNNVLSVCKNYFELILMKRLYFRFCVSCTCSSKQCKWIDKWLKSKFYSEIHFK